jgi:hypothetical protein
MIAALMMLTAQIVLTTCKIEGVPGSARCGTYQVWENPHHKERPEDRFVDHRP